MSFFTLHYTYIYPDADESRFEFNGKYVRPNPDYKYPGIIKISWFNFLEAYDLQYDDGSKQLWNYCGGESLNIGDDFSFIMERNQDEFDKNFTTNPEVIRDWALFYGVKVGEMENFKYAMGYIMGQSHDCEYGFGLKPTDLRPGPQGIMIFKRNWNQTRPKLTITRTSGRC